MAANMHEPLSLRSEAGFFDMPLNFSAYPLLDQAFEASPFAFVPGQASGNLAFLVELDLIENGSPVARAVWQAKQLGNLLQHARQKSAFWRARLPSGEINAAMLSYFPVLSRQELIEQIATEGSLMASPDGAPALPASPTTGSTGTPVRVFVTRQNAMYNSMRSVFEYFNQGWSVDGNLTRLMKLDFELINERDKKLKVVTADSWLGPLSSLFKNGKYKIIYFATPNDEMRAEMAKDSLGYLAAGSWLLERLLTAVSPAELKNLGMKAWIQLGGARVQTHIDALNEVGITTHANYSCEEIGPIAQGCSTCPDHYHVAHSNVVVEEDKSLTATFEGRTLSRVLLTHLHSYATPLIRYDVGDFAEFLSACPCGHQGTVLKNLYGRQKNFVRHADGRFTEFMITARTGRTVREFKEWRVQQLSFTELLLELSGVPDLTEQEVEKFQFLVGLAAGTEFKVTVKVVDAIDWSDNPKRLFFRCRI